MKKFQKGSGTLFTQQKYMLTIVWNLSGFHFINVLPLSVAVHPRGGYFVHLSGGISVEGEEGDSRSFGEDSSSSSPDCEISKNRLLMIASVVHHLGADGSHSKLLSREEGIDWSLLLWPKLIPSVRLPVM
jgi:hypothetical protein